MQSVNPALEGEAEEASMKLKKKNLEERHDFSAGRRKVFLMLECPLPFIYQVRIYPRAKKPTMCSSPMEFIKTYKLKLQLQNIIQHIILNTLIRRKSACGLFVTAEPMMNT